MYRKVTNPLAIQSQQTFCHTMVSLLETQPFEDITITHLCEEAHLVRKTFYRNFETKEDVLICMLDYQFQEYIAQLNENLTELLPYVQNFYEFWSSKQTFLKTLQENALFYLVNRLYLHYLEDIEQIVHLTFHTPIPDSKQEGADHDPPVTKLYYLHFLAGGLCDTLAYWISNDCRLEMELLLPIVLNL